MERAEAHFLECGGSVTSTGLDHRTDQGDLVSTTYSQYLVGANTYSGTKIIAMGKDDSTIITTWGDSGYWDATPSLGPEYCMYQLADGRALVAHNYYKVTMINTDGTTDTTWATSGTYTMPSAGVNVNAILEDSDGNFHLFGGVASSTAYYVYVKLDSDGAYIGGLTRAQTQLRIIYGAVWASAAKTRIVAAGEGVDAFAGLLPNMVAIDPVTYSVDTAWTGNIPANPGYAQYNVGAGNSLPIYHIYRTSDGGLVLYRNTTKLLAKVLADGSALDTTWGTNGELDFSAISFPYTSGHNPTQNGDNFYVISIISDGGTPKNQFNLVDSTGTITDTFIVTNTPDGGLTTYYSVTIFNDQLLFGHAGYVELWNNDFTYVSRFAVALTNIVWWVIPDKATATYVYEDPGETQERWVITGQANLIGEEVAILADGEVLANQIVNDDGEITLYQEYEQVHWGLAYEAKLKPMKPVSQPAMMSKVSCKQTGISVHNTNGIKYGVRDENMKEINFNDVQWKNKCEIDGLFTGTVAVSVPDGFSVNLPLQITTSSPLPCTVRAMIPKID
ncbi:MAG: hypothetical protein KKB38_20270 [Gammaproteobacteria bacterium]|nr:hypothetical protein [Gammaproteobacteria bacterium]